MDVAYYQEKLDSSPRTRRYFQLCRPPHHALRLFSAHAEVFPGALDPDGVARPLLRARGGISRHIHHMGPPVTSSPRTRRYFQITTTIVARRMLFSAHAEVFRVTAGLAHARTALLRARGGISQTAHDVTAIYASSPRTRRYFLV